MSKNVFRKISDIKEIINCFLVEILENEDSLVINHQEKIGIVVLDRDFDWNWKKNTITLKDKENEASIKVRRVREDEESLDELYINNYMLTFYSSSPKMKEGCRLITTEIKEIVILYHLIVTTIIGILTREYFTIV